MYESIIAKVSITNLGIDDLQTVCIGLGAVFAGLICIIIMCKVIGLFCRTKQSESTANVATPIEKNVQPQAIENRQQIIAAVSAAVAEELGTDVSAIRILSFKKI